MRLEYKTRAMSDPRGKAKVFFSCHPSDFEQAFPLITDDVLAHANCAIWYDPELADDSETLEAIEGMQLVVLAVTSRFLGEPNVAKDVVFPFAMAHNISVLPIMLETGLEYEFNEKCAPIQVVNRCVNDSTATPYNDVLETFLASALVGDELTQKVRDAFDAYVFLSYRKKDRRHAQRLMRLIHKNRQFRDIAIWYDEYLVPGEGFNEAIRDAFQKSSLFALAVTPNLLEPGNYVMDVEYPLAADRAKDERNLEIVPVEMYETALGDPRTNREDLKEKYVNIPNVQDEHAVPELDEAFVAALERVGRKEGDGSPQHLFFIGLAYLNGIDVEVDHTRALDLIEQAATAEDEPCIEAIEKLVDMYLIGDGVARDFGRALQWQQQVVGQYRTAYQKNHDPDAHLGYGTAYFRALMRLSDLQRESGNAAAALAAAEEALGFADELKAEVGVREMDRDMAVLLNRMGGLYRTRHDQAGELSCYRRALAIYERLASEMGTARARRDLSIGYERMGDANRRRKDLAAAESLYNKALAIREGLAAADDGDAAVKPRVRRDLSAVLTKLGNVRRDQGNLDDALQYYGRALAIDDVLAHEQETPQATDDWCVSLVKVGDVLRKAGDFATAIERLDLARSTWEELAENTNSLRYRKNYARCLGKLASACKHAGKRDEADQRYREAIATWEAICADGKGASDDAHELAATHYNYARFAHDRASSKRAIEIWERLADRDARYQRYLDAARK